jgi:tetratricopeptide (TPR) repeat protein
MADPAVASLPGPQAAGQPEAKDALVFIKENVKVIAIVAGLALLAVVIGMAYFIQQRRGEETAFQMLMVAESNKQLEELLAQYPSSAAAPVALLALAKRQFVAGAYDQAVIQYGQFLQQYPKHFMAPAAEFGKLICFEARGESAQALTGFTAFVTNHPGHYLLPQVLMGEARCLQRAQRLAEAKAVYEDYLAAHPDSAWNAHMEMALRFIERERRGSQKAPLPVPPAVPRPPGAPLPP